MSGDPSELRYDPYDFGIGDDPYPVWKRLRDERPLCSQRALRLLGGEPLRRRRGVSARLADLHLGEGHAARADRANVELPRGMFIFEDLSVRPHRLR